jgi:hypothetical protein
MHYVCLLVEEEDNLDTYLTVPVSQGRLSHLIARELDLRAVFETSETGEFYVGKVAGGDLTQITITPIQTSEVSQNWLPDPGFLLPELPPPDEDIAREAIRRRRAIIRYSLSPPEAEQESKISAEHLSQAVRLLQRVVTHAYQKALRDLSADMREILAAPEQYQLEVYGFSQGSFTLYVQTAAPADLFGYSQIARALEVLDDVVREVDDKDRSIEAVAKYGGHFATAYKDLLKFVAETSTPISYEWSMPEGRFEARKQIFTAQARKVYEALSSRIDIALEKRVLVGRLTKVDENTGSWRLRSEEDNKEYSGKCDPATRVELAGLVIETQRYEFQCEERLFEERGTGREITRLILRRYRAL